MTAFATLFAWTVTLFVLWLAERRNARFWRQSANDWRRMYGQVYEAWGNSHELVKFWSAEALRGPFHGKPKEIPRA